MLKIVTTVGTSLFENKKDEDSGFRYLCSRIEDKPSLVYDDYKDEINRIKTSLKEFLVKNPKDASAEITSNRLIKEKHNTKAVVILIASDTLVSVVAAEVLYDFWNLKSESSNDWSCRFDRLSGHHVIQGLQVNDKSAFEKTGLKNLMDALYYFLVDEDKKVLIHKIINITGGFKGSIPYLTIFGQLKGIPINYAFEKSSELIEIPVLPLGFDSAVAENYSYMIKFRSQLEESEKAELIKSGFIVQDTLEQTSLATLLIDYEFSRLSSSKNIIGLVVEYKLMEYYTHHPMPRYAFTERGNMYLAKGYAPDQIPKGAEIDVVLKADDMEICNTDYISIECKSVKSLDDKFEKMKTQFRKKIDLMKKHSTLPKEIHFVFYSFPHKKTSIGKLIKAVDQTKLELLKDILKEKELAIPVKYFFCKFTLEVKNIKNNPYSEFINERLIYNTNFKEITHGVQNV